MAEPHKDRSTGLIVFGGLHILLGLVSILLLLATAASAEIAARRNLQSAAPQVAIAQGLLFYGVAAFYFIAIGIGSIRARRWARALAAAVTSIWTIGGIFALAVLLITLPHVMVLVPPSQETAVKVSSIAFVVLALILLPLGMALFYASRDTGLTCDERDPRQRWTDRVPVSVLALALVLAFGAVMMLINAGRPVYVAFGYIMTGAPAALAIIAFAILFAYLAVQVYRLRESAWWVLLLLHVITGAMSIAALGRTNLNDIYQRTGMLTPQVQAMHLEQITKNPALWITIGAGWLAYLWFLIRIRRYFASPEEAASAVLIRSQP